MRKNFLKFVFAMCSFLFFNGVCLACDIDVSGGLEYELNAEYLTAKIKSINKIEDTINNEDKIVLNIPNNVMFNEKIYSIVGFSKDVKNQYSNISKLKLPSTFIYSSEEYLNLFNFINECFSLKFIQVDDKSKFYSSDSQGMLYNKEKTKLIMCPRAKEGKIEVPNLVNTIDLNAFKNCPYIMGCIEIPSSVNKIEKAGCKIKYSSQTNIESENNTQNLFNLICLIGESGSGKSTIGDYLVSKGYKNIFLYTTRKKRFANEEGRLFIDDEDESDLGFLPDGKKKLAYIGYFSGNWYWVFENQLSSKSTLTIDPYSVANLKNNLKDNRFKLVTMYLKADRKTRFSRMIDRMAKSGQSMSEIEEGVLKRMSLEISTYSSFDCDCVLDTSIPFEKTIEFLNKFLVKNHLVSMSI